jgi:hypothetical protein
MLLALMPWRELIGCGIWPWGAPRPLPSALTRVKSLVFSDYNRKVRQRPFRATMRPADNGAPDIRLPSPGRGGLECLHNSTPPVLKWKEPSLECGSSLPLSRPEARFRSTSRQQAGEGQSGSKLLHSIIRTVRLLS